MCGRSSAAVAAQAILLPLGVAHHGQDNGRLQTKPAAYRFAALTRMGALRQAGAEASCNPAP
ncbi:hypothetical protein AB395_00004039 [Sinorhizobium fredii CCBAU 45436]|nr:hypothetical protein SF83666_c38310 [Sinorhizobium fredii CCBAU 83666]AWI59665.1 hypothetical protein AB395_00004039 [Sinorhizobium fredii CCBAU 45436]AWM27295.1 hypothetical protein AOX55_00004072 [Sinorhizobium fredii CCBAU 25509]